MEQVLEEEPLELIGINPLAKRPRSTANVSEFRNLVFEFDGISLPEQAELIKSRGVPFSTLVFSGGKSLHATIALTECLGSVETYKQVHKLIRYVLWQSDPTSCNPDRLCRMAGAKRFDKGGVVQELIDCRERVEKTTLFRWLGRFEKHIAQCEQREKDRLQRKLERREELGGEGIEAVSPFYKAFLSGDVDPKHVQSRHDALLKAAYDYFTCGVDYDKCLEDVSHGADLCGITMEPGRQDEAVKIVNYVYMGGSR